MQSHDNRLLPFSDPGGIIYANSRRKELNMTERKYAKYVLQDLRMPGGGCLLPSIFREPQRSLDGY